MLWQQAKLYHCRAASSRRLGSVQSKPTAMKTVLMAANDQLLGDSSLLKAAGHKKAYKIILEVKLLRAMNLGVVGS